MGTSLQSNKVTYYSCQTIRLQNNLPTTAQTLKILICTWTNIINRSIGGKKTEEKNTNRYHSINETLREWAGL